MTHSPFQNVIHSLVFLTACVWCSHTMTVCNLPSSVTFIEEPRDVTVEIGGNASFMCQISSYNPETDSMTWRITPFTFSYLLSRSLDESSGRFTTSISFTDVGPTRKSLQCIIQSLDSNGFPQECYSKTAFLHVYSFPPKNEMKCNPAIPVVAREGSGILISCHVPTGNPAIELTWSAEGMEALLTKSRIEGTKIILTQELYITRSLHSKKILCVAKSNEPSPAQNISCSIGPITVLSQPVVTVQPSRVFVPQYYTNHTEIKIICMADAYPPIQVFKWTCTPHELLDNCVAQNNTVNVFLSQDYWTKSLRGDIFVTVTCTASNGEGVANASANIMTANPNNTLNLQANANNTCEFIRVYVEESTRQVDNMSMDSALACTILYHNCSGHIILQAALDKAVVLEKIVVLNRSDAHNSITESLRSTSVNGFVGSVFVCSLFGFSDTGSDSMFISDTMFINDIHSIDSTVLSTRKGVTLVTSTGVYQTGHLFFQHDKTTMNFILITVVAVVGGILSTACIFIVIAVALYKYLMRHHSRRLSGEYKASQNQDKRAIRGETHSKDQRDIKDSNEEIHSEPLYEETTPVRSREDGTFYCYHQYHTGEFIQDKSYSTHHTPNFPVRNQIESDGYEMPSYVQSRHGYAAKEWVDEGVYSNQGMVEMHMLKKQHSVFSTQETNDLETTFPSPPPLPMNRDREAMT